MRLAEFRKHYIFLSSTMIGPVFIDFYSDCPLKWAI